MMKKVVISMLCIALAACMLCGCSKDSKKTSGGNGKGGLIGVAMPTKDLQRWNQDGENMKKELEKAGFEVELQYASNDVATQVSQIETMISNGCKVLVIASIDGDSLGTVLKQAKDAKIPVVAYDRLIMNSDAVSYYATFDNYNVGTKQGQYIEDKLGLKEGKGPFNLEIFTGDPGDNNANFFYNGAMDVLKKYIDNGKLVVKSGSTKLDAVLCSNDSTANGVTNAIDSAGWKTYPIITGQDCDITSVKNMIAGKQSMSIFKDTRKLASKTVEMVEAIMKGTKAPVNDTNTYDNGKGVVPSYLCEPVFADKSNYQKLLIDSGYYKESDLK